MRTIVFAASKGGVGKTTLTAAVGVVASRSAVVAVGDMDPQQSLARWFELRGKRDGVQFLTGRTIEELKKKAREKKAAWLFVDTPPALMTHIAALIAAADFVVVPLRPSPLDVEAIEPVIELCRRFAKPFGFVVNAAPKDSALAAGAVAYLAPEGRVLKPMISQSDAHVVAMIEGRVAAEIDAGMGREMAALWRQIEAWAGRAEEKQSARNRTKTTRTT